MIWTLIASKNPESNRFINQKEVEYIRMEIQKSELPSQVKSKLNSNSLNL